MLKSPKRKPDNSLYPANQLRGLKEERGLRVEDLAARLAATGARKVGKNTINEVLLGQDVWLSDLIDVAGALGAKVKISFERE